MNNRYVSILKRISGSIGSVADKYDIGALPAFLIFLVVVTLGMIMNFIAMRPVIGDTPALLVSGLFEFGILGWKWTSSRRRNNDEQDELVNWATWVSVLLAVGMLVINLFRTTIEQSMKAEPVAGVTFNGWQIAAYITIGLAALAHIVFYLFFDHADTDKANARKNQRSQAKIEQRNKEADHLVANADADLKILEKITVELGKLRTQYEGKLPHEKLEIVLENARQALLVQYQASDLVKVATEGLADLDHSGAIGDEPIVERPGIWISDEQEFKKLKEKYPEVPGKFVPDSQDYKAEPVVKSDNGKHPPFK